MKIGKSFTFEAAHRLRLHDGKCRNLHGHSYRVEVTLEGLDLVEEGPKTGMLFDFNDIKKWWQHIEPMLDHTTILEETDPLVAGLQSVGREGTSLCLVEWPPTAENLAGWILEDIMQWRARTRPEGADPMDFNFGVRVYETPTSWAEAR